VSKTEDLSETEAVDRFIDSLDHLDQDQLMVLHASWRAVDPAVRGDAWAQVRAVAARQGLTKGVGRVRDRAMSWATRGADLVPYNFHLDDMWLQLRQESAPAIVDAAIAVALGDRLDEATRDVLLGPWLRASEESAS
jgi:hypothetical protein